MLLDYWELVQAVALRTRLGSITLKVFYHMNVNLTVVESTLVQLFCQSKQELRRKLQNQHQFHHLVQAILKTHSLRLDLEEEAWTAMPDILAHNIHQLLLVSLNMLHLYRDHHLSRMHKQLILQVTIIFEL